MRAIVAILNTGESQFWLMLNKQSDTRFSILGWETEADALAHFTDAYNRNHERSYEASMSACINFIEFQPRIVVFKDLAELEAKLLPPGASLSPHHISSISGHYDVLPLQAALAQPLWTSGETPVLITHARKPSFNTPRVRSAS